VNERTCVLKMKNSPTAFLLGDIFFKRAVVIHDMRDMQHPVVQIGKRNPQYSVTDKLIHIAGAEGSSAVKVPISKVAAPRHALEQLRLKAGSIFSRLPSVTHSALVGEAEKASSFDRTPLTSSNSFIYYAQISAGSPPQSDIHVIVDTGSSVFAIFSVDHGGMSTTQASCRRRRRRRRRPLALFVIPRQIILLVCAITLGVAAVALFIYSFFEEEYPQYQRVDSEFPSSEHI
jgi:hypothetical protein